MVVVLLKGTIFVHTFGRCTGNWWTFVSLSVDERTELYQVSKCFLL
jgi:hypothetical protein